MEIFSSGKIRNRFWCLVFAMLVFPLFVIYLESSTLLHRKNQVHSKMSNSQSKNQSANSVSNLLPMSSSSLISSTMENGSDPCSGKYIYVHNLPRKFNSDLLKECQTDPAATYKCPYMSNGGFGPELEDVKGVLAPKGWFATDQFALEVIFHTRMKQYKCLTSNSSLASAIYVPFYAGLDISRHLLGFNLSIRDELSQSLVDWLRTRPEWKVMWGRDHFVVAGRLTWEFRRRTDNETDFGNNFMLLPEAKNMTMLDIEASPWEINDIALPYPTYFHPSSDNQVFQWQNRMRRQEKKYLFSFAGAPRPDQAHSIRNQIIAQCQSSQGKCKLLECDPSNRDNCFSPRNVMKLFQNSIFCLQPPGDSPTRRSAFDSILAGCIPVFFSPASAYVEYVFYLPQNYSTYSVYISEEDIRNETVNIGSILEQISDEDTRAMREEVIRLIPKLMYALPTARMETIEDAFDIAVKRVIEMADEARKEMKNGTFSDSIPLDNSLQYKLWGRVREHQWDHLFGI